MNVTLKSSMCTLNSESQLSAGDLNMTLGIFLVSCALLPPLSFWLSRKHVGGKKLEKLGIVDNDY